MSRVPPTAQVTGSNEPDFYEILQVSRHASSDVIKAAYRALARNAHPDVNGCREATSVMRQLNTAYEELCDPVRRAAYDARLRTARGLRAQRIQARERLVSSEVRRAVGVERSAPAPAPARRRAGALPPAIAIIIAVVLALAAILWAMGEVNDDGPLVGPVAFERNSPQVVSDLLNAESGSASGGGMVFPSSTGPRRLP